MSDDLHGRSIKMVWLDLKCLLHSQVSLKSYMWILTSRKVKPDLSIAASLREMAAG